MSFSSHILPISPSGMLCCRRISKARAHEMVFRPSRSTANSSTSFRIASWSIFPPQFPIGLLRGTIVVPIRAHDKPLQPGTRIDIRIPSFGPRALLSVHPCSSAVPRLSLVFGYVARGRMPHNPYAAAIINPKSSIINSGLPTTTSDSPSLRESTRCPPCRSSSRPRSPSRHPGLCSPSAFRRSSYLCRQH